MVVEVFMDFILVVQQHSGRFSITTNEIPQKYLLIWLVSVSAH